MGKSQSERMQEWRQKRQKEIDAMPKIQCGCGCGEMLAPLDIRGRVRTHLKGHKQRGTKRNKPSWNRRGEKPLTPSERQREYRERRQKKIEAMEKIPCACGCGTMIPPLGKLGRPIQYAHGHNPDGVETRFKKGQKCTGTPFPPGDRHPHWRGGVGTLPYGPEFTKEFKRLIRKRDQYTCQRCGITQQELGYTIHIHHLDFDKTHNDPTNLVCACSRCNNWANFHRDDQFINEEVWVKTHILKS